MMHRPQTHRPDPQDHHPLLRQRTLQPERKLPSRSPPNRNNHTDALRVQTSQRNLKHTGGGRIEPLRVVDRDEQRGPLSQLLQRIPNRQPDRQTIKPPLVRLRQQQRDLKRPAPRSRKRSHNLVKHLTD